MWAGYGYRDRVWALSPSLFRVAYSSIPTGWHHVVGAVCGSGGCGVVSFDPALWIWGSMVHWSSPTLPLHRHWRTLARPACCESGPAHTFVLTRPTLYSRVPASPHPPFAALCAATVVTSWRSTTSAWLCGMSAACCPHSPLMFPSPRSRTSVWVGGHPFLGEVASH